jgi:DNA-binding HxlR family transcriptional regulator
MIALALAPGRTRLTHLHARLPGVSTGVLERYIQQMVALGLVSRRRFKEMPPRVELELTDAGRDLLPVARALTRWGMRHAWSAPRERERVDVGALLRLLPVLLEEHAGLPDGCVEAVVADADPPLRRRYRVQDGRLCIAEEHVTGAVAHARGSDADSADPPAAVADVATARLHGDGEAWVAALGPAGNCERLRITGDKRLARHILAALPRRA